MSLATVLASRFSEFGGGNIWMKESTEAADAWHHMGYVEKGSLRPNDSPSKKKDANGKEHYFGSSRSVELKFTCLQMDIATLRIDKEVLGKTLEALILCNPNANVKFNGLYIWAYVPSCRHQSGGGFEFPGGTTEFTFGVDEVTAASVNLASQTLASIPSGITPTGWINVNSDYYNFATHT